MLANRRFDQWKRRSRHNLPAMVLIGASGLLVIYSSMVLPASFVATALIVLALIAELWRHRRESWALPALVVYSDGARVVLRGHRFVPGEVSGYAAPILINYSYGEVLIFVLSFRLMVPFFAVEARPAGAQSAFPKTSWRRRSCSRSPSGPGWCCSFARSAAWIGMWSARIVSRQRAQRQSDVAAGGGGRRGRDGISGFHRWLSLHGDLRAVRHPSRAGKNRAPIKTGAAAMMALTWPFFLLCGTRNQFLAVAMPCVFCYGLLGRQKLFVRMMVLAVCFLFVNFAFKIVIGYRGVGYMAMFEESEADLMVEEMTQEEKNNAHEGLNMIQELCYENSFLASGQLPADLRLGLFRAGDRLYPPRHLAEQAHDGHRLREGPWVRRRRFGHRCRLPHVSTGLIGQGVLEFGGFFGPMAPAFLMAVWCGLLGRWWQQRVSILRMGLFLLALGITFNLGRNITNIALWPVAFAYLPRPDWRKSWVDTRPVLPEGVLAAKSGTSRPPTAARAQSGRHPPGRAGSVARRDNELRPS